MEQKTKNKTVKQTDIGTIKGINNTGRRSELFQRTTKVGEATLVFETFV